MSPAQKATLSGLRILVVEDQALVALDLQGTLEERGATVAGPCLSLPDAMRVLRTGGRIDGAILDVDLDGDEVFDLADRLRARRVPFVFHTGHADIDRLHERYADVPVLLKPARADDVAHELGGVMGVERTP